SVHFESLESERFSLDFGDVKELFKPVFQKMDHNNLNEIEGLEDPSIIDLIKWMSDQLKEDFPELNRLDLYESEGVGAELHIDKGRYDR
ncbi:MAG TPA: 6-carboxytetrahydropterin synthase, partial [SAR86 cluster bacterium]|nr:6-carboxytetrahydropterin synthase [SAR86 cluster bacterium]